MRFIQFYLGILPLAVAYSSANTNTQLQSRFQTAPTSTFPPLIHSLQSKHSTVPPPKTQERQPSPANLSPVDRPQTPSSTHPPIVYETSTAPIIFLNGKGPDFGIDVPNRGGVSTHPPLIHRGKRATTSSGDKNADNGPGRCHWAIIGCCEGSSVFTATTNECLDSLGCPGPYWDVHPCSIVGAAIQSTVTQYIDKKQE